MRMAKPDPRQFALTSGVAYLVIIVCGLFAEFGVRQNLFGADLQSVQPNFMHGSALLRVGIAADLMMLIADVVVAWGLFGFFSRTNREISLLAAFFRLVQAGVIASGLIHLMQVLRAPDGGVSSLLLAHADSYRIGLVFFGACCLVIAWLALRSREVPRVIGYLLYLAGFGYLADTYLSVLWAGHSQGLSTILLLPAFAGEVAFAFWLVGWGGRTASEA